MKKLLFILLTLKIHSVTAQCSVSLTPVDAYCGMCNGAISSTPTGVAPFTYSWSGGENTQNINPVCFGNYTLTVTDHNNCKAVGIVSVGLNFPVLTQTVYAATCATCCNGSATLSFASPYPPYTYSYSCTAQTTSVITGLCGNTCNMVIADSHNCGVGALLEYVQSPVGLTELTADNLVSISPNPFSQEAKISMAPGEKNPDLLLYNAFGEIVLSVPDVSENMILPRGQLKSGVYFFRLRKNNSLSSAKKVVITD